MEHSIFLARLLGLYLLIVAGDLILRRRELESAVKDFASSKGLLVFSGSVSLLFGLAIVLAHPVYEWNWRGLITLIGYLVIVRGAHRMAFPKSLKKRMVALFHRRWRIIFLVLLILGAYLTYWGFAA